MANLLSVMMPEPGHIIPALELARSLKELGHTVSFVTLEHFDREIRRVGFDCVSIRTARPLECNGTNPLYSTLAAFSWRAGPREEEHQYVLSIFDVLRTTRPDMVLVDRALGYMGRFLEALRLRYLFVGTNFGDSLEPLDYRPKYSAEVLLCPESIAGTEDLKDTNRYFFEPPVTRDRSIQGFPWERVDPGKPLVYCSFGTQVDLYPEAPTILREIIHYLSAAGSCQLVAVTGSRLLREYEDCSVPGVIVTACAPQLDIIERADVLISHGGLGTIKEALQFCVPMFLIPFAHDQFANADRIVRAGYGRQLISSSWSMSRFKEEFETFQDCLPQLRENLRQRTYSSANGKLSLSGLGELITGILQSSC